MGFWPHSCNDADELCRGNLNEVAVKQPFVISELNPDEIPEACELFHRVFGQAVGPDHWRWKYMQGPRLGCVNVVLRGAGGELLGHAGASIFPGCLAGATLSMAQVCDLMIDSSVRGGMEPDSAYQMLFNTLRDRLGARISEPYGYGFAGIRPFKLGTRKGFYRELRRHYPGYFSAPKSQRWISGLWTAEEIDWDIRLLDNVWSRRVPEIRYPIVLRTGSYLGWRYRDHPANEYRLWLLSHLTRDRGWFITRSMPDGEVCIVDALLPESVDPQRQVLALVNALASTLTSAPPVYAWFLPAREGNPAYPVIGGEFSVKQWHTQDPDPKFQPGDTDVY